MLKLALVFIFSLLIPMTDALASTVLSGLTTKRIGTDFFVEMNFSEDISDRDVKIQYLNDSIEVVIPHATAAGKKTLKVLHDSVVDHLQAVKSSDDNLRFRMTLAKPFESSQFEKTTSYISKTNKLLLKIGDPVEGGQAAASTSAAVSAVAASAMTGDLIDSLMKQQANSDGTKKIEVPVAVKASAESEETAPVFKTPKIETSAKDPVGSKNIWARLLFSLLIVFAAMGGAFYALKKWPGTKKMAVRNRMIEVMAQHPLGPKKSVAVLRVAGEAVLVGITDNQISILKTLSLLDEEKFQSALDQKVSKNPEEEFSMKGLKDIVNDRLKTMRTMR